MLCVCWVAPCMYRECTVNVPWCCRAPRCRRGCAAEVCKGDERELEGGTLCRHFCSEHGFCGVGGGSGPYSALTDGYLMAVID
jgi:hypothetical protein